jgi:hypothetical protein
VRFVNNINVHQSPNKIYFTFVEIWSFNIMERQMMLVVEAIFQNDFGTEKYLCFVYLFYHYYNSSQEMRAEINFVPPDNE